MTGNIQNNFRNFIAINGNKISLIILLISLIIPIATDDAYILGLCILTLINIQLSLSVNLLSGYTGILSLGQAAFFGVGAYIAAILSTSYNLDFVVTTLIAITGSMLVGTVIGFTSLKVSGRYLAIITLGLAEIIRVVALNWMEVTRGPQGITAIPGIVIFGENIFSYNVKYYAALLLTLIAIYIMLRIESSKYGRSLKAIRDDELAAASMGINTSQLKIRTFAISAGMAGAAGAIYAHYMGFINPTIFSFSQSVFILSMAILGGLGSIPGSILGAIILTFLPELLRFSTDYRQIIYGFIILVLVIFKPSGILGDIDFNQIRNKLNQQNQGGIKNG